MLNLARAFIEHTAALAYQIQMLEKGTNEFPKKADLKDLRKTIARHREAARKLYYNKSAAIHIHDMIKALARLYEPIRREYDALCEFVHPNYGSNRLGSVDIHAMARKAAERWMKAQKLVSVLS